MLTTNLEDCSRRIKCYLVNVDGVWKVVKAPWTCSETPAFRWATCLLASELTSANTAHFNLWQFNFSFLVMALVAVVGTESRAQPSPVCLRSCGSYPEQMLLRSDRPTMSDGLELG